MKNFKKPDFKKYFKEIFKKYLSEKSQKNVIKYAKIGKKIIQSKATFLIFSTICIYLLGTFLAKYILNLQFGDWEKANEFLSKNPKIAEYSQIITILVSFLFVGIFRNWRISMGILFSFATVVMYINTEKMASRNTPFLPEDLAMSGEAGGLASMINLERFLNMLFTIVVIIIITIIINKISKKIWHFKFSRKQKIAIFIPQIALILICAHFLNLHTLEIRNLSGKGTFIKVENLETSIDFTDQAYNYRTNGFILATISNLQTKTQKQPEDYSKKLLKKIIKIAKN